MIRALAGMLLGFLLVLSGAIALRHAAYPELQQDGPPRRVMGSRYRRPDVPMRVSQEFADTMKELQLRHYVLNVRNR